MGVSHPLIREPDQDRVPTSSKLSIMKKMLG